jgi:hypothetical protein
MVCLPLVSKRPSAFSIDPIQLLLSNALRNSYGNKAQRRNPTLKLMLINFVFGRPAGIGGAIYMERVMGIEPTLVAWEATVLPLNYTRTWVPRE